MTDEKHSIYMSLLCAKNDDDDDDDDDHETNNMVKNNKRCNSYIYNICGKC